MMTVGAILRSGSPASAPEPTVASDRGIASGRGSDEAAVRTAAASPAEAGPWGPAVRSAEEEPAPAGGRSATSLLSKTADLINRILEESHRRLKFSVHQATGRIWVQVIDTDTNEVIKEIPPERYLDLVARIWELVGILVDKRA